MESQGKYWVYEYEGPLSEMEDVKALLSWKNEYVDSSKPQVCLHLTLGDAVYRIRQEYFGQIIVYVYQQALDKKPRFDILKHLKITA